MTRYSLWSGKGRGRRERGYTCCGKANKSQEDQGNHGGLGLHKFGRSAPSQLQIMGPWDGYVPRPLIKAMRKALSDLRNVYETETMPYL